MRNFQDLIKRDIHDVMGWCLPEKRAFIESLVRERQAKRCVEIGVWKGSSLLCFANALAETQGTIVGIDPWALVNLRNEIPDLTLREYVFGTLFTEQETLDAVYRDLEALVATNGLADIVSLVRKPSWDAFMDFEVESIDVLCIDGNHDEIHVSRDILMYLPLVKRNGAILMDDTNYESVAKAIRRYLDPYAMLGFDGGYFACYVKR